MALRDTEEIVKWCDSCQRMSKMSRLPATQLQPLAPVWPLARWGIDIIGPIPMALGGFCFAVVSLKYFSKWVEAEPITAIKSANIVKFFWMNIVCHFGVSREVTSNGACERANESIFEVLSKRIFGNPRG
ncbi:uncharacterized protein [Setaria viridis]|uniref:uncharacterized protein n=1 Tax=Setaria viridis TaxID=4556 RepID=UPI003B3B77FF